MKLLQHENPSYGPRTYSNARAADVTIAFAVDFFTAGEKLTEKASPRYIAIDLKKDTVEDAVQKITSFLKIRSMLSSPVAINIAGNGIYTLSRHQWTQSKANLYVYDVLSKVSKIAKFKEIRSGGQTGIDIAGLVAGEALSKIYPDIEVVGLFPKGFRQRKDDFQDIKRDPGELKKEIISMANELEAINTSASISIKEEKIRGKLFITRN